MIKVYDVVPDLHAPKFLTPVDSSNSLSQSNEETCTSSSSSRIFSKVIGQYFQGLSFYFHHPAFLPSFTCALLYCTVLSFSGQMITYLSSAGFSSLHIGISRTFSVLFEMSATWIAPVLMTRIGPVRSGLWFISWQTFCLAGGVSLFVSYSSFSGSTYSFAPFIAAIGLTGGTILSRIGLWGFDLSTQIIVQEVS